MGVATFIAGPGADPYAVLGLDGTPKAEKPLESNDLPKMVLSLYAQLDHAYASSGGHMHMIDEGELPASPSSPAVPPAEEPAAAPAPAAVEPTQDVVAPQFWKPEEAETALADVASLDVEKATTLGKDKGFFSPRIIPTKNGKLKVLFKSPTNGTLERPGLLEASLPEREALFYRLSRTFGIGLVPPTAVGSVPKFGKGSRQLMVEAGFQAGRDLNWSLAANHRRSERHTPSSTAHAQQAASLYADEAAAAYFMDCVFASGDRRQGNYMIGPADASGKRHLVLIDNGISNASYQIASRPVFPITQVADRAEKDADVQAEFQKIVSGLTRKQVEDAEAGIRDSLGGVHYGGLSKPESEYAVAGMYARLKVALDAVGESRVPDRWEFADACATVTHEAPSVGPKNAEALVSKLDLLREAVLGKLK